MYVQIDIHIFCNTVSSVYCVLYTVYCVLCTSSYHGHKHDAADHVADGAWNDDPCTPYTHTYTRTHRMYLRARHANTCTHNKYAGKKCKQQGQKLTFKFSLA